MLGNIQKSTLTIVALVGVIIGIALTVYVANPLSNDKSKENKNNHGIHSSSNAVNTYTEQEKAELYLTSSDQTFQDNTIAITHTCEQQCLDVILMLEAGEPLSAQQLAFIIKNATVFSNALLDEPDAIANLLSALQDDETDRINPHDAAYAIVEALSLEQKINVASAIGGSSNSSDRVSALKLLQSGIKNNEQAVDVFVSLLSNEYDTSVKIIAINMARQVSGEYNQEKTRYALNNIIQSSPSSYTSGEALLAKISISPSATLVAQDINDFVSSPSPEQQKYGLQAIETSMERYNAEFDAGNQWQESDAIQASIQAIIQDDSANTALRNKAQDILERFF